MKPFALASFLLALFLFCGAAAPFMQSQLELQAVMSHPLIVKHLSQSSTIRSIQKEATPEGRPYYVVSSESCEVSLDLTYLPNPEGMGTPQLFVLKERSTVGCDG